MDELVCSLHLGEAICEKILPFSHKSWLKISECGRQWILLDCPEHDISSSLFCLVLDEQAGLPVNKSLGYHKKCYQRFTDKTRIEKTKKRIEKQPKKQAEHSNDASPRLTRSGVESAMRNSKNSLILPKLCIICKSENKIKEKYSGKRKREELSQCETNNNNLLRAAIEKNDENLLLHIRNKDIIAIEMSYHRSCYKHYTKYLTVRKATDVPIEAPYEKSFLIFSKKVIEDKIIKQHKIYEMNKLTEKFIRIISETENEDIVSYRNDKLKRRIMTKFPQIDFIKRSSKNLCEIVMCSSSSASFNLITNTDSSSTEVEDDDLDAVEHKSDIMKFETLQSLYRSSLILKHIIKDAPANSSSWPPIGSELTVDSAMQMVPMELFNFLSWCVGASDDASVNSFVDVPDNIKLKILSISQDILFLASNGRKHTPKHLALGMTVRHYTGSAKLIGLLNGLGHCVSHSTVLEHDTALALQQLERKSLVPEGFHSGIFTTLVWDNNDFGEETLTGSGTTHNTNGIILQWDKRSDIDTIAETCLFPPQKKSKRELWMYLLQI